jgi:hypothetical protein
MEFTIFQRGSGIRYVGDYVGSFGEWDCVLLGSHLPHCWMEQDRTDGYVLQFHLPNEHPLRRLGGEREDRFRWCSLRSNHRLPYVIPWGSNRRIDPEGIK